VSLTRVRIPLSLLHWKEQYELLLTPVKLDAWSARIALTLLSHALEGCPNLWHPGLPIQQLPSSVLPSRNGRCLQPQCRRIVGWLDCSTRTIRPGRRLERAIELPALQARKAGLQSIEGFRRSGKTRGRPDVLHLHFRQRPLLAFHCISPSFQALL